MLTESDISIFDLRQQKNEHTDRNKQFLSSPDLGESLDNLRLRSDIPTELFLSSTISVEETSPIYQHPAVYNEGGLTLQKKEDIEVSKSIDLCGRILSRKIQAICTSYRHIDRFALGR
jgi:hypothetical protein